MIIDYTLVIDDTTGHTRAAAPNFLELPGRLEDSRAVPSPRGTGPRAERGAGAAEFRLRTGRGGGAARPWIDAMRLAAGVARCDGVAPCVAWGWRWSPYAEATMLVAWCFSF